MFCDAPGLRTTLQSLRSAHATGLGAAAETNSFNLFSIVWRPSYVFQTSDGALLTISQLMSFLVKWLKSSCFLPHCLSLFISIPELTRANGIFSSWICLALLT